MTSDCAQVPRELRLAVSPESRVVANGLVDGGRDERKVALGVELWADSMRCTSLVGNWC